MASDPRLVEISVQTSGGGKVAIKEYGKVASNWGISLSRRYEIPESMTEGEAEEFQLEVQKRLRELIEPLDQAAFDERIEQADWVE